MQCLNIPTWPDPVFSRGNADLLANPTTAFLCSRTYPAGAVLRIYDWAKEMRESGECVLSGFHSRLEQDVLEVLLRGSQPIILAAARGLPKRPPAAVNQAIEDGRLLVISPFPDSVVRITVDTARQRNRMMLAIADNIVIGHMSQDGVLAEVLSTVDRTKAMVRLTD